MSDMIPQDFHLNKKAWADFAEHVQKNVALIAQSIADRRIDAASIERGLQQLNKCVFLMFHVFCLPLRLIFKGSNRHV